MKEPRYCHVAKVLILLHWAGKTDLRAKLPFEEKARQARDFQVTGATFARALSAARKSLGVAKYCRGVRPG